MKNKILLQFDPALSYNPEGDHVRDGLSTVLRTGNNLWLACDERTSIERLTLLDDHTFGEHQSFQLEDFLELPGKPGDEVDIEGMSVEGNYLWITGSHSLRRKKPRKHDSVEDQMERIAKVKSDPNRYLLARIPLVHDAATGNYTLHKECTDPDNKNRKLRAGQLKGEKDGNLLTEALQKDKLLAPFLTIPSKDNGFDIEGLAANGNHIYIGLRGPVLRGWSVILEIEVEEIAGKAGFLKLKKLTPDRPYKKHLLQFRGKGIREMRFSHNDNDLLILAGPTMDLDGVIAVYRWQHGLGDQDKDGQRMVRNGQLERLFEVPHGKDETSGKDKAEGVALFDENTLLVVFDSPTDERKIGGDGVLADLYKIPAHKKQA